MKPAVVRDYQGLLEALRARRDELKVTHATIDHVSGIQGGYASKLMADPPLKLLGAMSFGAVLGALGLQLVVVEDPDGFRRVSPMIDPRKRPRRKVPIASIPWLFNRLNAVAMAKRRAQSLTPEQRKKIARKGGKARWRLGRN